MKMDKVAGSGNDEFYTPPLCRRTDFKIHTHRGDGVVSI